MQVRPADSVDPGPLWPRSSTFSLRLFGPFSALVHGQPLPKPRSRKETWLLALLILHANAPLERSWFTETLWPDALGEAASYNLRRSLHGLRVALGPEANRLLSPTPRTLRLDLTGADCDVTAFDAALRRGDPESLAHAAALYGSPLLLGCPEEWALPEREARERAVLDALERLAAEARERGDLAETSTRLGQALEIDPLRETALRGQMETLGAQGRHAAAVEAYLAFRRRLRTELNAEPDLETLALYRRLQTEGRRREGPPVPVRPSDDAPDVSTRLPSPLTSLIGREQEIEAVTAALDGARLVTLTGTGGVGKTRLALAVAHRLHNEFPDGAWFADLASLADPDLIAQAVLAALGGRETAGQPPSEALAEFLRPKRLLLVLDNCEHLVEACAGLARALLERCVNLHLLATSREPLRVAGEVQWRVPSLPLPQNPGADQVPSDAVRLFVERARQTRPGWTLSETDSAAVTDICRRLDGIPLAIEMAAARTRVMTATQIAARLDDCFRLLVGTDTDSLPRRRTLRATLDWSWDLLSGSEKALLARLSVFAGGGTLEAIEQICGGDGIAEADVLDGLTGLIDRSLVVYEVCADGEGRYRLLETVRQYARERLTEDAGTEAIGGRHAAWFLALAEQAFPVLLGPAQAEWLARLETEHDNLLAALSWYALSEEQSTEEAVSGLRLAGALGRFWETRGHFSEGQRWLVSTLARTEGLAGHAGQDFDLARAKALSGRGHLAYRQGDFVAARAVYEESLTIYRRLGASSGVANSLSNLGNVAHAHGDYGEARALYEESLAIRRQSGEDRDIANSLHNLGLVAYTQGDFQSARPWQEESLAVARYLGDRQGIAFSLINLAMTAYQQGDDATARILFDESLTINRDLGGEYGMAFSLIGLGLLAYRQSNYEEARALFEKSLTLRRRLGDQMGITHALVNLGNVAHRQGDHGAAREFYQESLTISRRSGDRQIIAFSLEGLATVAHEQNRPARAARLLGAAQSLRETIGSPLNSQEGAEVARQIALVRETLGEKAFDTSWRQGHSLSWEQAAADALGETEERSSPLS